MKRNVLSIRRSLTENVIKSFSRDNTGTRCCLLFLILLFPVTFASMTVKNVNHMNLLSNAFAVLAFISFCTAITCYVKYARKIDNNEKLRLFYEVNGLDKNLILKPSPFKTQIFLSLFISSVVCSTVLNNNAVNYNSSVKGYNDAVDEMGCRSSNFQTASDCHNAIKSVGATDAEELSFLTKNCADAGLKDVKNCKSLISESGFDDNSEFFDKYRASHCFDKNCYNRYLISSENTMKSNFLSDAESECHNSINKFFKNVYKYDYKINIRTNLSDTLQQDQLNFFDFRLNKSVNYISSDYASSLVFTTDDIDIQNQYGAFEKSTVYCRYSVDINGNKSTSVFVNDLPA